eukprot:12906364-Prorocentrum_lima.AAC.1
MSALQINTATRNMDAMATMCNAAHHPTKGLPDACVCVGALWMASRVCGWAWARYRAACVLP